MSGRRAVRFVAAPVLAAVLGVIGGLLWWTWWAPAPQGQILSTRDGSLSWFPIPFDPQVTAEFSGTATFAVIALVLGVVFGLAVGVLHRHRAVVGVLVALAGAAIASGVMLLVGLQLSPPDPATLIASHREGDQLPGHLELTGWTPYLLWPGATLLGYVTLLLALPMEGRPEPADAVSSETTWSAPLGSPATTE